jgi:serine phosphatase RsbU (regulator of sigma subunit)
VTEVGPSPDEFFDVEGVQATVRQLWSRDAAAICDGLLDEVVQRAAGPIPDDATVVVAKFTE